MEKSNYVQAELAFKTKHLGKISLNEFILEERLSEVPTYRVSVDAPQTGLHNFIGQEAEIILHLDAYLSVKPRRFHGLVMDAEHQVNADGRDVVQLTLRPLLAVLSLSKSCVLYQKQSGVDILNEVLKRNGLNHINIKSQSLTKRDTVIQYNENDLDFCTRLLAEEGCVYFFSDGKKPDTLVIHNTMQPFSKVGPLIKLTDAQLSDVSLQQASSLTEYHRIQAGRVSLISYDPKKAQQEIAGPKASSSLKVQFKPTIKEFIPVPIGDLKSQGISRSVDSHQSATISLSGHCEHPAMHLGQELVIHSEEHKEIAGQYLVTALNYTPIRGNAVSCRFEAVSIKHPPVPKQLPKPLISGVHNALVVGGSDGEISCDAQGRVKVKFFWDTSNETNNTSGYISVAESFAGKGYGTQFIPRVGHEVLVSFLYGDPDVPVITGQIYNKKNPPPFATKNATKSGIRTKLKGEPNELEFDDKAGSEMLALRAAKNYELIVNENAEERINKIQKIWIGEDASLKIDKNQNIEVGKKITLKTDERKTSITKADSTDAKTITFSASEAITLKVGSSKIELSSSGIKLSATSVSIDGKSNVKVSSNGSLVVSGTTTKLEAKTKMDVKGALVNVSAQAQAKVSSPMSEVSGMGMLTLKGGITMIN